jgi:hypothetical protein
MGKVAMIQSARSAAFAALLAAGFDVVRVDESQTIPEQPPKPEPAPLPPPTMTRQQRRYAERQAFKRLPK